MHNKVDDSAPEDVWLAIEQVRNGKGMSDLAWTFFSALADAPDYRTTYAELESISAGVNTHFGWFCNEVLKALGGEPDPAGRFALCDVEEIDGHRLVVLKPKVVAALSSERIA
jgi:hypothetical protein